MTLRYVIELVVALAVLFALALVWAAFVIVVGGVQRYFRPPEFLLPNGLVVQMPFDDLHTADIIGASGRSVRRRVDWMCFDDRTVWLSGNSGTVSVDAVEGRIVAERHGRAADDSPCKDRYFRDNTGLSLFLDDELFPCDRLNPDLDRFAQAQRFRDLCDRPEPRPPLSVDPVRRTTP